MLFMSNSCCLEWYSLWADKDMIKAKFTYKEVSSPQKLLLTVGRSIVLLEVSAVDFLFDERSSFHN